MIGNLNSKRIQRWNSLSALIALWVGLIALPVVSLSQDSQEQVEENLIERLEATIPYDEITVKADDDTEEVIQLELLDFAGRKTPELKTSGKLEIRLLGNPDDVYEVFWRDIVKIRLYEDIMIDEVNGYIDSFKFDAGESNWMPSHYALSSDISVRKWPGVFSSSYVETCALFGPMVEVRTGRHSQQLPVWVRMLDKFSTWGLDNGLKSMVTTLLQFGLVGHPFVLPDMVGGNGYGEGIPSRELYIRWLQMNVFMPSIQISFVPWMYDKEVVEHAVKLTELHAEHAPTILALAQQATEDGSPINRPV